MTPPTAADWPYESLNLDEQYAWDHFFGKTMAEAVLLFEENSFVVQEDLGYMPTGPFRYYLHAFMTYLLSDVAEGDAGGANSFVGLIDTKSEHEPDALKPIWSGVEPVLKHVIEHQHDVYEADWFPYRDFRTMARRVAERGFPISIDLHQPEMVPDDIPLQFLPLFSGPFPWPVAVQILAKLGLDQLTSSSRKSDVLHVLGSPESSGGGQHSQYGFYIPHWMRFHFRDCSIRFEFEEERIVVVHFSPLKGDELDYMKRLTDRFH